MRLRDKAEMKNNKKKKINKLNLEASPIFFQKKLKKRTKFSAAILPS